MFVSCDLTSEQTYIVNKSQKRSMLEWLYNNNQLYMTIIPFWHDKNKQYERSMPLEWNTKGTA